MLAHRPGMTGKIPLTQMSASVAALRRFSGKCCFQVIYFKSNISFSPACQTSPKARVETIRLTHAVKNAWPSRFLAGLTNLMALEGAGEVEKG
jgi:hypothetical protein